MDYVSTLCALGTAAGVGAVGLSFGSKEHPDSIPRPTSKKRKAPGPGPPVRSLSSPLIHRGGISAHGTNMTTPDISQSRIDEARASISHSTSTKPAFWRRMSEKSSQIQTSTPPISRQSSVGPRRSLILSVNQDDESSVDRIDAERLRPSPSWLKRISTISSLSSSPVPSIRPTTPSVSLSNTSGTPFIPSGAAHSLSPNKLVKRTSSHRALSANHARPPPLRRPATSHQRSATFGQMMGADLSQVNTPEPQVSNVEALLDASSDTPPLWRPYFSSGYEKARISNPRIRHTSNSTRTETIRPVRNVSNQRPTLLLANSIEPRLSDDDLDDNDGWNKSSYGVADIADAVPLQENGTPPPDAGFTNKRRSRHSFSISDIFSSGSSAVPKLARVGSQGWRHNGQDTSNDQPIVTSRAASGSVGSRVRAKSAVHQRQRRRNVTDPTLYCSDEQEATHAGPNRNPIAVLGDLPLSPISNVSTFEVDLPRGTPTFPSTPFSSTSSEYSSGPRVSSSHATSLRRMKRVSLAASDPASTTFGSDFEARVFSSGDEDSMDFQSDTAYDSLATRATASSHSGLRGPGIDTIFDESPPSEKRKDLVALEDLMGGGTLDGLAISVEKRLRTVDARTEAPKKVAGAISTWSRSAMQEEEHTNGISAGQVSTPVSTPGFEEEEFMMTPVPKKHRETTHMSSSPPSVIRHSQKLPTDDICMSIEGLSMDDESEWDKATDPESIFDESMRMPELPKHSSRRATPLAFRIHQDSEQSTDPDSMDWHAEQRLSIFDWSEQQKSERDMLNGTGPRPRTVHGKQTIDNHRGSRPSGRRGPSALHLRSQSVPVARESLMENDPHYPAAKFGTWGLGNKGVSEEWNDDFDFDDPDEFEGDQLDGLPSDTAPTHSMRVPQSIIDRQASVHGQFSQVQEFMLLVEELKRLRVHGSALQLLEGQYHPLWEDAENIVNLATLNDDEDNDLRPPRSPPWTSSFDDFDDNSPPMNRFRKQSDLHEEENDSFEAVPRRSISSIATPPNGRPRGESLAQAKSFLQTIHQSRNGPDSSPAETEIYQQKKLPFDTQDLRDLVGRAGNVTRALKEIVRKAEGVSVSPDKTPKKFSDPAFSQIFHRIEESPSPSIRKPGLPKSHSAHSYLGSSANGGSTTPNDNGGHMKMMMTAV